MARLLVIDDDEDFATAVASVAREEGYEVEIELESDRAIEAVRKHEPDLVLLDVMFPEDSSAGFDLARKMRKGHNRWENLPILMLTAINTEFPLGFSTNDIDEEWLPVTDFVEKPVDFDDLLQKVEALLESSETPSSETGA
ncbi:MAG: response regulator transcription factor [Planctomycetota bacterium]